MCFCMVSLVLELCTPYNWANSFRKNGSIISKSIVPNSTENRLEDDIAQSCMYTEKLINHMKSMKQKYEIEIIHLIEENKNYHLREKQLQENVDYLMEENLHLRKTRSLKMNTNILE